MTSYKFTFTILGDGNVGKTTFLNLYKNGEFLKKYNPTYGAESDKIILYTNEGRIDLKIWDVGGEIIGPYGSDIFCMGADAVIIMFDLNNIQSYKNINKWYNLVYGVCGYDIPIVLCGNKKEIDIKYEKSKKNFYEISCKYLLNIDKPIIHLLEKLLNKKISLSPETPLLTSTK